MRAPSPSISAVKPPPKPPPPPRPPQLQMPARPSSSQPSPPRSPLPVLRWLPSASASTPATPPPSVLLDALSSTLPALPPQAHRPRSPDLPSHPRSPSVPPSVPPSFLPLQRAPAFLRALAASTLPTSSLSSLPTATAASADPAHPSHDPGCPIVLEHSPPTRSSLDSLRALHDRTRTRDPATASAPPPTLAASPTAAAASSYWSAARTLPPRRTSSPAPVHSASFSTLSAWRWFQPDTKHSIDPLLADDDRAPTLQEEHGHIHKKYLSPKHPVVFCHGLLGFDSVTIGPAIAPLEVSHWRGIKEVLEANGTEVLITRVPATSSPVDRAKVLERTIEAAYPGRAVHLIGHSMGGLDCRYLTTHLRTHTFTVLSLTTLATPHRGSAFADHFLATVGRARLPSVLALLDLLPNGGGDGAAFECLTRESMRAFNDATPDVLGVRYFSWGAQYEPGLIDTWKWPHSVILEQEGPNDGLVSVESSKWGTYLGTLHDVNHLDLVGWINAARYKWAALCGREIQFRPATFYLGVADLLAREVDGLAPPAETDATAEGTTTTTTGTTAAAAALETEGKPEEAGVRALGKKVADEGSAGGVPQPTPSREGGGRPARARSITDDPWDATSDRDDDDDDDDGDGDNDDDGDKGRGGR